MMLTRKGIWVIVLFFLCSAVFLLATDVPENADAHREQSDYLFYLEQVGGEYTEQKAAYLEKEAAAIAQAQDDLQTLRNDYYMGTLSQQSYEQQSEKLKEILSHERGFEVLYEQYLYIHENPQNRYFLPTNGWHGLLADESLDFLMMVTLLLLITPVFCQEYSSRMDVLLSTASKGTQQIREKLLLVFLLVTGLCVGWFALRYGFFAVKYGLPHGEYPLQSLPYFGSSVKTLSLRGAFLLLCGLKWCGNLFFATMILFFSVVTKKYAPTVFLSSSAVLLPYLGLSHSQIVLLPLPLPFLLGNIFLRGSQSSEDFLTGESIAIFSEVSWSALTALCGVSLLLCGVGVLLIIRWNRNRWLDGGKRRTKKYALVFCCLLLTALCGCQSATECDDGLYNQSTSQTYLYEGNRYYYDGEHNQIFAQQRDNNETRVLTNAPLDKLTPPTLRPIVFGSGSKVYYMKSNTDSYVNKVGRYSSTIETISIVEVGIVSFQEKIVFERNISKGKTYLGVEIPTKNTWDFLWECNGFFLNHDHLFFVCKDLYQLDRRTGKLTTKETFVLSAVASNFCLTKQGLFYSNRKDNETIYFCSLDGADSRKIIDRPADSLSCEGDVLFFTDRSDFFRYQSDLDGKNIQKAQ